MGLVALTGLTNRGEAVAGNRVLVIGDSLLNFSQGDVSSALSAAGWQPGVDGRSGTTIEEWDTVVGAEADFVRPNIAVVELGTNDCNTSCSDLTPYIDGIIEQLIEHGAGVVLWLNVQTTRSPPVPGAHPYPLHADYVNYAIEQAEVRWPQVRLVDLSDFFAAHPEWHLADGVHPNAAGEQAMASLITGALSPWAPKGTLP